ncbi:GDSL esterase/lipase ACHE-like isoform X1 [Phoenix dactylifera]|uniref:GDSL esterase/lipase ACHE-like isoform X1 n=1 Tax=Phoenix dactylifera TaxID=42345 RepID=A0A8B7CQL0_PHODC|nr:GDSL esterase/lipase ACHE-like isoform X1 [Phoenix dactylifera]
MASYPIFSLIILALSSLLPSLSISISPCDFPAIFNFGDSNSDTGGLSAAFGPAPPPNGETFFGMPAGRYSDGRLIIDFIAQSLGLPYLSAYLDSVGTNFSHGANFATAGSTIRRQNKTLFQGGFSPFSLDVQSWQFSQFKSRSQLAYKRGGVFKDLLPTEDYFSRALYTFDIGQNDLTSGYFDNMTTEEVKAYVPDVLNKFTIVVKNIYGQGGRFFWIHNTGPFGCLPYVLDRLLLTAAQVDRVGCGAPFNEVAKLFNVKLKKTVNQLRKDLPLAVFTYVDVYSVKYELISQANKHGFEHPLVTCCGHGGKYNYNAHLGCGGKITVNNTEILVGKSCEDPSKRTCWDGVHYTEAANKWVFDQIVEGAFSDPPIPLRMACKKQQ